MSAYFYMKGHIIMNRKLSPLEIENIKNTAAQMAEKQRRQFLYRKAAELGCGGMGYISRTFHVSNATLTFLRGKMLLIRESTCPEQTTHAR